MDTLKRTFLKLSTTLVGGLLVARYTEPLQALVMPKHDWVEDKGDFTLVRVPAGKTIRNIVSDKPVVLWLGAGAVASNFDVKGFVNMMCDGAATLTNSLVDGTGFLSEDVERTLVEIRQKPSNHGARIEISHCTLQAYKGIWSLL